MGTTITTMTLIAAVAAGSILLAFIIGIVAAVRGSKKLSVPEDEKPQAEGAAPQAEEEKEAVTLEKSGD